MRFVRIASIAVLAFAPLFALVEAPRSVASSLLVVTIKDECAPDFNTFVRPGTCNRAEGTPFLEFIAEVRSDHAVGDWAFDPDSTSIDAPATVAARNIGGETHSFTKVARFGNGFVAALNNPADAFAPECAFPGVASSFVGPGATTETMNLPAGTNRFQCCIHPWMRTTINVER